MNDKRGMSIRHNLQDHAKKHLNTSAKRYSAAASLGALAILVYTLNAPETPVRVHTPEPIVQGEQLRFPAAHP